MPLHNNKSVHRETENNKCIQHPQSTPLVMLRSEYLQITNNHCAAKLLAIFEFWTNKLREKAAKLGTEAREWIYKTLESLHQELMGEHGIHTIRKAINLLVDCGFLNRRHNPHIKYDRTWQYQLNIEKIQEALNPLICHSEQMEDSSESNPSVETEPCNVQNCANDTIDHSINNSSKDKTQKTGEEVKKREGGDIQHISKCFGGYPEKPTSKPQNNVTNETKKLERLAIEQIAKSFNMTLARAEYYLSIWRSMWNNQPNSQQWLREKLTQLGLSEFVLNAT
jgi:hypothetical protein